jgi:hypothetical protein
LVPPGTGRPLDVIGSKPPPAGTGVEMSENQFIPAHFASAPPPPAGDEARPNGNFVLGAIVVAVIIILAILHT